ncbi:MAG: hypothetical protein JOY78_05555 [Pseudonocardia sp.]|nr:hypothetical protein [Pseudonocardia sp.]
MRPTTALAPLAPLLTGVPAAVAGALPPWALSVLLAGSALLTAAQVATTQIIRLRASNRITRSTDNLRVLEIEDLPHHRQPPTHPAPTHRALRCGRRFRRPPTREQSGSDDPSEESGTGAGSPDLA